MGPNLYLTPGGFTSFHQDGHGTVDSGHTCHAGYNEVVMLRRLPDSHKRNAMKYLPKGHDALYEKPHDDGKVHTLLISVLTESRDSSNLFFPFLLQDGPRDLA